MALRAVISDFGGVLTTPLMDAFARANAQFGVPVDTLHEAMRRLATAAGEPPLFRLERGELSEGDFLGELQAVLSELLAREVDLDGYGARLMGTMERNEPLFAYFASLRERGVRLAILTNNVREWQPLWRERLRIDELFELVVDSGFEGVRKPEPEIYARTLERLGLPGKACAFVDDLEINIPPARAAGVHAIHFRDTDQAIAELDALLTPDRPSFPAR